MGLDRVAAKTILVGAIFHLPKYTYSTEKFTDSSFENLTYLFPDASVILTGDFNKLDVGDVSAITGLLPLVNTHPMRYQSKL